MRFLRKPTVHGTLDLEFLGKPAFPNSVFFPTQLVVSQFFAIPLSSFPEILETNDPQTLATVVTEATLSNEHNKYCAKFISMTVMH